MGKPAFGRGEQADCMFCDGEVEYRHSCYLDGILEGRACFLLSWSCGMKKSKGSEGAVSEKLPGHSSSNAITRETTEGCLCGNDRKKKERNTT